MRAEIEVVCTLGILIKFGFGRLRQVNLVSPVADFKRVLFVLGIVEGHCSSIYFILDVGPTPRARSFSLRHLPLRDVCQLSLTSKVFKLGALKLEIERRGCGCYPHNIW